MKLFSTYYHGPSRSIRVTNRNPLNLYIDGIAHSQHKTIEDCARAAQAYADIVGGISTCQVRVNGGIYVEFQIVPRADVDIFFSSNRPAFARPHGASMSADTSATSAGSTGSIGATVPIVGAASVGLGTSPQFGNDIFAFPTAVGFAKDAVGGRGGQTIKVTNLNNTGAGSFRNAVGTAGARIVVFEVSGNINLTAPLNIGNPNLTIAGQTSPGGICIAGHTTTIETSEVIVRHMRFRVGSDGSGDPDEKDSLDIWGSGAPVTPGVNPNDNIIIDHCSVGWGVDENFSTSYDLKNVTIQKCLVHEGLTNAGHSKGNHSKGLFIWGKFSPQIKVTMYKNAVIHCYDRVPLLNTGITNFPVICDAVNNVSYNHFGGLPMGTEDRGIRINWRHNFSKAGPSSNANFYEAHHWPSGAALPNIYMLGNMGQNRTTQTGSEWLVSEGFQFQLLSTAWQALTPWETSVDADTMSPTLAQEIVDDAGVQVPSRDSVEILMSSDFASGGGSYRTNVSFPGSYPTYANDPPPTNTSGDGIPDSWKTSHGLNISTDYAGVTSPTGYDWLEDYINELAGD